jgi:hypothetical protein
MHRISNSYEPGSLLPQLNTFPNPAEMASSQSIETIILKGPDDWEPWSTQFKAKAVASELWDLINPEEEAAPFDTKPVPPKVQDYDKRLVPREIRSQSSATIQEEVDPIAKLKNWDPDGHNQAVVREPRGAGWCQ